MEVKTVLIDGNSILWRLAKRMPPLSTSSGDPVQIVYGMFRVLHGTLLEFQPHNVLVLWDCGNPVLRIQVYEGYKFERNKKRDEQTKEELEQYKQVMTQMEIIKDVLPHLGICQYEVRGLEGDDLISLACQSLDGKKIVVSGDKDMLQLVDKDVSVYLPVGKTREYYNYKNFERKVGLTPEQFLEVKILIGDSGDEVPGVAKGFGEKSATELIKRYGKIDALWSRDVENQVRKMGKRFQVLYDDGVQQAVERNRMLVDLKFFYSKTACLEIQERIASNPPCDELKVRKYFKDNEFYSLLKTFHGWITPFKRLGGKH
jgi:DNA polymerase-1